MGTERAVETTSTPAWAAAPMARVPWWRPWRRAGANLRGAAPLTLARGSWHTMTPTAAPTASRGQPVTDEGDQDAFLNRLRQAGL